MDDLGVLLEFYDAGEATDEELDAAYARAVDVVDDVEFRSTLNNPEDEMSCILEINAGISCGQKKTDTRYQNSTVRMVM